MRRFVELILAAALVLAAGSCELSSRSAEPTPPATAGSYQRLVWPQPPAPTKIRYVRSIAEPRDLGIKKSFFGRLMTVIAGKEDGHLVRPTGVAERDGVVRCRFGGSGSVDLRFGEATVGQGVGSRWHRADVAGRGCRRARGFGFCGGFLPEEGFPA